jgi:hypothetical protein
MFDIERSFSRGSAEIARRRQGAGLAPLRETGE